MAENIQARSLKRCAIIGAGNLGSALARALRQAGLAVTGILDKSRRTSLPGRRYSDLEELLRQAELVFLCLPESQIKPMAKRIAKTALSKGRIFFHTASSLTAAELLPIKKQGGLVASFSPLQTFLLGSETPEQFHGVYFLVEGDGQAISTARVICRRLQAHVLKVDKQEKMHLHIAAVAAANFLVAILAFAEKELQGTSSQPGLKILQPLIQQTLRHITQHGPRQALTGPVKRGEDALIRQHLRLLQGQERKLYRTLSEYLRQLL